MTRDKEEETAGWIALGGEKMTGKKDLTGTETIGRRALEEGTELGIRIQRMSLNKTHMIETKKRPLEGTQKATGRDLQAETDQESLNRTEDQETQTIQRQEASQIGNKKGQRDSQERNKRSHSSQGGQRDNQEKSKTSLSNQPEEETKGEIEDQGKETIGLGIVKLQEGDPKDSQRIMKSQETAKLHQNCPSQKSQRTTDSLSQQRKIHLQK